MNNQIVPISVRQLGDDEEPDEGNLGNVVDRVCQLSRRQSQLAELQVQTVQYAKVFIEDRVSTAEKEARAHAEILGHALSQVQVDHHTLKEYLSVYLQGIADSARQQIDAVYQELRSRHAESLQSCEQRVQQLENDMQSAKCAAKSSEQALAASQSSVSILERQLEQTQRTIAHQESQLAKAMLRIDTLEEQIQDLNHVEARIFERNEKQIATAQLSTAASIARLAGRLDRVDGRADRQSARNSSLMADTTKLMEAAIEKESQVIQKLLVETEQRLQSSTVSRELLDETYASVQATLVTQARDILSMQTTVAQIASTSFPNSMNSTVAQHTEQIAAIKQELEQKEREVLILDQASSERNHDIRILTRTQEQHSAMLQQLFHTRTQPLRSATGEEGHTHDGVQFAILSDAIVQQQGAHVDLQAKVERLDASIEDRIEEWVGHATRVQEVRWSALVNRDSTSESPSSSNETDSEEELIRPLRQAAHETVQTSAASGVGQGESVRGVQDPVTLRAGSTPQQAPTRSDSIHQSQNQAQRGSTRIHNAARNADEPVSAVHEQASAARNIQPPDVSRESPQHDRGINERVRQQVRSDRPQYTTASAPTREDRERTIQPDQVPYGNSAQHQRHNVREAELLRAAREAAQEVFLQRGTQIAPTAVAVENDRLRDWEERLQQLEHAEQEDIAVRTAAREQALQLVHEHFVDQRPQTGSMEHVLSPPRQQRGLQARLAIREQSRRLGDQQVHTAAPARGRSNRGSRLSRTPSRSTAATRIRTERTALDIARDLAQEQTRRRAAVAADRARGLI